MEPDSELGWAICAWQFFGDHVDENTDAIRCLANFLIDCQGNKKRLAVLES
jgi:hypothetical protein